LIIKAVKIERETIIKIFEKHNVLQTEIYDVLKNDNPRFKKEGGNQYAAIGLSRNRYITIFFTYDEKTKEAEINTAYPADKSQIKSYKRMI
jgi:hypothetical protein